jgi:MraZ protein
MNGGFAGSHEHAIDEKGRIIVPARFRQGLGKDFVITRGIGACIFVLPKDYWDDNFDRPFRSQNALNKATIRLQRHFSAESAPDSNFDGQGRITIPQALREYASITQDTPVMICGVSTRIEIWNKQEWIKLTEATTEDDILNAADEIGIGAFKQNG